MIIFGKFKFYFIFLPAIVLFISLFVFAGRDAGGDNLKLYAIKYGDSLYHSKHIYYKDDFKKPLPFSWMFYLIKYKGKTILVDTGFGEESLARKYNINYKNPLEILEEFGVKPLEITDVIITHSHFDHIGNADKFENAKIYIQKDELDKFKRTSKNKKLVDFFKNGKNIIAFGDFYTLYGLFKIEKIGGHTIGSSIVSFNRKNKKYVLTGDECYLLDNCDGKPIGTYYDIKKNKNFIENLKRVADKIILTFHDPLIFNRYQKINEFIAKII